MVKKIMSLVLCGAIAFSVVGCSSNNETNTNENGTGVENQVTPDVSVKELSKKVIEAGFIRMPMEADDTMAKDTYGLNLDNVDEYAITETGVSPGPGVLVAVKAKEGKLEEVKANVQEILNAKVGNAYYPEEVEASKAATIETVGNIVYFTIFHPEIAEDATTLVQDFLK